MFADEIQRAVATATVPQLDQIARDIWRAYSVGVLNDTEAQAAAEAVHARTRRPPTPGSFMSAASAYPPRRPQRSPDRQASLERRRRLAASGPMPPTLACKFTTGQLAALRIVSDEIRARGVCALHVGAIADRSGVSRTTAQNALREARRLGFVTVQERRRRGQPSETNLVRVVSGEWLTWLRLSGRGFKNTNPNDSRNQNQWKSRRLLTVSPQRFVGVALERDATPEKHHDSTHSWQRRKGNRRSEIDDLPGD